MKTYFTLPTGDSTRLHSVTPDDSHNGNVRTARQPYDQLMGRRPMVCITRRRDFDGPVVHWSMSS